MGCVNIQCHLQWVQFEKGRMDGLGAGGGRAAKGKFPGQGNEHLSRQQKKKNEHTIICSLGKSTVVMCQIQFNFFLCMCKLLYSSVDVRIGGSCLECKGWRNKCQVYYLLLMPASKGRPQVVN